MISSVGRGMFGEVRILFEGLPDSRLYANRLRTYHWRVRSVAERERRLEACLLGSQLQIDPPLECVEIRIVFHLADHRRRDLEGMMSACKPWLDGLTLPHSDKDVGCGIIVDDDTAHVTKITVERVLDAPEHMTEIIIMEVKDGSKN